MNQKDLKSKCINEDLKIYEDRRKLQTYTFIRSFIAKPATSWLDDYNDWSISDECCFSINDSFCPHQKKEECQKCDINKNAKYSLRPDSRSFRKYIPYFLKDEPNEDCAKGGRATYADVRLFSDFLKFFI